MRRSLLALTLMPILTASFAISEEQPSPNVYASLGYVHLNTDEAIDRQFGIMAEIESVRQGWPVSWVDLFSDFSLSHQSVAIEDDEASGTYFVLRIGPGRQFRLSDFVEGFATMKFKGTYEWLSINGESQNANGRAEFYWDYRPEAGLVGELNGWAWRTSIFSDGFESRADRSTLTVGGQLFRKTEAARADWGIKLQVSADKLTAGISVAL